MRPACWYKWVVYTVIPTSEHGLAKASWWISLQSGSYTGLLFTSMNDIPRAPCNAPLFCLIPVSLWSSHYDLCLAKSLKYDLDIMVYRTVEDRSLWVEVLSLTTIVGKKETRINIYSEIDQCKCYILAICKKLFRVFLSFAAHTCVWLTPACEQYLTTQEIHAWNSGELVNVNLRVGYM